MTERELRRRVERRHKVSFWGRNCVITPRLCDRVFGDGKALIYFTPLDTRPNYYVVRVDSRWDVEWNFHDHCDLICEALEEQFGGDGWNDWPLNPRRKYSNPFPALSDSTGVCWGRVSHATIPWPTKERIDYRRLVNVNSESPQAVDAVGLSVGVTDGERA